VSKRDDLIAASRFNRLLFGPGYNDDTRLILHQPDALDAIARGHELIERAIRKAMRDIGMVRP
jgi:hypothetical protein